MHRMMHPMGQDLMDLVRDAQQGNRAAVAAVLDDVLADVRAYVRVNIGAKIRARESASDLVQSICREVLEDIVDFRGDQPRAFKKWLFCIALNKIRRRDEVMKAQCREVDREVSQQTGFEELMTCYGRIYTPSRIAQAREDVELVEAAMAQLPDEQREVITKRCILQMSHVDIADEMERSETAVRKLLSRARARLSMLIAKAEMQGRGT